MSYSRTISYNSRRQTSWSRNQNTTQFRTAVKLGPVTHTILIGLMMTVLGLIYLTQATKVSSFDYQADAIADRISSLSQEKDNLEVENARLTAMQTIKDSEVAQSMTTPTNVERVSE